MKTNRLKTIGITVGVCATLWFLPNSVEASEDGTSLNLDINLLNEKEDKAAIVDIQIDNIPLVGDLKVKIPSINTVNSEPEEEKQKNSALATVELGGGDLVEDLDVSVLEKTTSKNATSDHQKSSLASVVLTTPLTEEVDVDVLLSDATTISDSSSFDAGVIEVNAPNLPILGDTHVGVVDKHTAKDSESSSVSTGLVQADLDGDLLKDTAVKVLATDRSSNEKGNERTSALVSTKVNEESLGGLVEDLDVSVLEKTISENATSNHQKSSLASVGLTAPLTEEVDVDVLLSDATTTSDSSAFDGAVIEVNAPKLPILGDTHVGVVDEHTAKDSESSSVSTGLVQADLDGDLLKDTAVKVLARNKSTNADGTTVSTDGVSVRLGTDLGNAVKVAVLTNEQVFPSSAVLIPTHDTGGDETTPTPDIPATDIEEIEKPDGGDGLVPNTDDQTDGTGGTTDTSKGENDLTVNKERNTNQAKPTYRYVISSGNTDLAFDFANSTDAQNSDGFKGNMGAVLPKTGGPMNGALLTLLSLVLLASGLAVRRVATREQ